VTPFPRAPRDPRLDAVLADADVPAGLFDARQHEGCERVEEYVLRLTIDLVGRLGMAGVLDGTRTADDVVAACGFVADFRRAAGWLLARLAAAGLAVRDAAGRWALPGPLPPPELAAARAAALEGEPSYAPTYAMLDEAAAIYPRVARGETSGDAALFRKVGLWVAYFANANAYYALNNRLTAHVAARRLPPHARVLEIGAGLGSATEALLEAAAPAAFGAYRVTEPVEFFRRRAERTLTAARPDAPLVFAPLDLNAPWEAQGVAAGSQDVVWGVNVFHLAHDLDAGLAEARAALAAGGWLVVGEGVRPADDVPVGAELPFQILHGYAAVRLDPTTRPTPGFLTAERWLDALRRTGFTDVTVVPDVLRMRAIAPNFYAAAICGRRR
jgi:SAM-dependent methyltransferase